MKGWMEEVDGRNDEGGGWMDGRRRWMEGWMEEVDERIDRRIG